MSDTKPVFKVDRVYEKGQEEVVSYIVALRVGQWTETITVPKPRGWFESDETLKKLQADIQSAKKKLLLKHAIFAEEFPEVEAFGQQKIEAQIRRELDLPALEAGETEHHRVSGEVVA